MESIDHQIGRALRDRRLSLSIEEEAVAAAISVSVEQLRLREAGAVGLSAGELFKACGALDLNPEFRVAKR